MMPSPMSNGASFNSSMECRSRSAALVRSAGSGRLSLEPSALAIRFWKAAAGLKNMCENFDQGTPIPTVITAYGDRTFTFVTKTPPAAWFIQKAANIAKGGATPSRSTVGSITMDQVREIAEKKMPDLNANDIDAAAKQIAGTARSMGVQVME